MINSLLLIRIKQLWRALLGIGLMRLLFVLVLCAFAGVVLYANTADNLISQYISIGFLILISLIHLKRGDKLFLKTHFQNYKVLLLVEYTVLALPIVVCFFIHKQWIPLLELLAILLIVNLDFKKNYAGVNTRLQALIPTDAIEWKAGVRKYIFVLVPIWLIAALGSFFIGSVPVAIFIFGFLTISFYERCEPCDVLLSYELSAKQLLLLKIKRQLQLFSLIVLPLIVLFLLFNSAKWYIPVAEYFIFCSLHVYVVVIKYAFYESNQKLPAAQTLSGIGTLGGIIPVFLPVVWILTAWFYVKSINNLNFYLDDFNR